MDVQRIEWIINVKVQAFGQDFENASRNRALRGIGVRVIENLLYYKNNFGLSEEERESIDDRNESADMQVLEVKSKRTMLK